MADFDCDVPIPSNLQELDQAVQTYKDRDFDQKELFCRWQAIRDASLEHPRQLDADHIPGDDSY